LAAGLCPEPLGKLTALPGAPSWLQGVGPQESKKKGGEGIKGGGKIEGNRGKEGRERAKKGKGGRG